jgi:hypothetical protein
MNAVVDRALRDHVRYTGDGLPNEPTGAPLPLGDPASGVFEPQKKDLRDAMTETIDRAEQASALLVAGSPYRFPTYADMAARLRYSGATGTQINVVTGDRVDVAGVGAFAVAASGDATANILLPSPSNVRLNVINSNDVQLFGADGVGDESTIAAAAAVAKGSVHLSRNATNTYDLSTPQTVYAGRRVSADPGVTVTLQGAYGSGSTTPGDIGDAFFDTEVRAYLSSSKNTINIPPSPSQSRKDALQRPSQPNRRFQKSVNLATEVTPLQVASGSDTFTAATGAVSGQLYQITTTGAGSWRGGFVQVGPGEQVSGSIRAPETSKNIGVMIRGTSGYSIVYGDADGANYTLDRKPLGGGVVTASIAWSLLGQGRQNNCSPRRANWAVVRTDADKANVLINGQVLVEVSAIGHIYDVGFVMLSNTATINIQGLILKKNTAGAFGKQRMERLFVYGDSTASAQAGAWPSYMQQLLDAFNGTALDAVANFAVAGTNVAAMLTAMSAGTPFIGASHVVVCGGTNDTQLPQTALATFEATVTSIAAMVQSAGKKLIWVLPWQFYGRTQTLAETGISGLGQDATGYDLGKDYRDAITRIVLNAGGLVFDPNEELPFPDVKYIEDRPEWPLLRDNIHQDYLAYQKYAEGIAQVIVDDYWSTPDSVSVILPATAFDSGASRAALFVTATKEGMIHVMGTITVSTIANYTRVAIMPRWARPLDTVTMGSFDVRGTSAAAMWCDIQTNGDLRIIGAPAGTTTVSVNFTYRAAF